MPRSIPPRSTIVSLSRGREFVPGSLETKSHARRVNDTGAKRLFAPATLQPQAPARPRFQQNRRQADFAGSMGRPIKPAGSEQTDEENTETWTVRSYRFPFCFAALNSFHASDEARYFPENARCPHEDTHSSISKRHAPRSSAGSVCKVSSIPSET